MTIFLHLAYIQLCSSTPWEYCCDPGKKIPKAVCNLIVYVMWIVWFLQNTRWTLGTMVSEPFVGKSAVNDITRDLYHYRDAVSSKEKFYICKSGFTVRVTYRNASPCPANDVPLHQPTVPFYAFLKLVGRCNGISLTGHGETFRWVILVVKTLLHM